MKRGLYITLCVFAILCGTLPQNLHSLTVEISGGLDSIAFNPESTEASGEVAPVFESEMIPFGMFRLSGTHNDITYNLSLLREPILRNRVFIGAKVGNEYLTLEAGPMLAIVEAPEVTLKPGASGGIWLSYPGLLFVQATGSSTLEINPDIVGNFTQYNVDGGIGFWLPHIVASANIAMKNFTIRQESDFLTQDALLKYFFRGLIHTKNIPFTIQLDMGMASLSRSYITQTGGDVGIESTSTNDVFTTMFAGIEVLLFLTPRFSVLFGVEMPLMSLDEEAFQIPEGLPPFRAWAGVSFSFGQL